MVKTIIFPVTFLFWSSSGYFIFVYSSYLTVDPSALWIWINHPHAIKTNFANMPVVEDLFIWRSYATVNENPHRFPSVMGGAILELVHPYLVFDESVTFAMPHGPEAFET